MRLGHQASHCDWRKLAPGSCKVNASQLHSVGGKPPASLWTVVDSAVETEAPGPAPRADPTWRWCILSQAPGTCDYLTTQFFHPTKIPSVKFSVRQPTLTYETGFREALLFPRSLCPQHPGTRRT